MKRLVVREGRGGRIEVGFEEPWREVVQGAVFQERPNGEAPAGLPNQRKGTWWVDRYEDVQRMLDGTLCWQCITPLPGWPSPENVPLYAGTGLLGMFASAERRIRERCCPMCGWEVSPDMVRMMVDIKPGSPGTPQDVTDADRHKLGHLEASSWAEMQDRMDPGIADGRVDNQHRQLVVPRWITDKIAKRRSAA